MSNISIERLEEKRNVSVSLLTHQHADVRLHAEENIAIIDRLLAFEKASKEPLAWIVHTRGGNQLTMDGDYVANAEGMGGINSTPLYAAPQLQRT